MKDRLSLFFINPSTSSSVKKVSGWKDSKPTKTRMSTEIKLTKDDEADSVDSSKYRGMIGSLLYLTASRPDIMFSLEVKRDEELRPYIQFKLGQFTFKVTPSRLSRILQTPHTPETFYSSKWSLNSLDDHPKSNFFGPKHDLVKKAITTPRTTQAQLLERPQQIIN
ncbi:hypothetical protein Tco_1214551 [Tanacetum coccineum]